MPAHALLHPPQQAPAGAPCSGRTSGCVEAALEGVTGGAGRRHGGRAACFARRAHRQQRRDSPTRRRSRRCSARARRDEAVLLRPRGAATRKGACERKPRRDKGSCCPRAPESGSTGSPRPTGAGHIARELRAPRRARLRDARARASGRCRGVTRRLLLDAYGVGTCRSAIST